VPVVDQIAQAKEEVKASLPQVHETKPLMRDTMFEMAPRYVLGDGMENEVLTWEVMDSSVVQPGSDCTSHGTSPNRPQALWGARAAR
jgi:hypothetical protein